MEFIFIINGVECRMKELFGFPVFQYHHNGKEYEVRGEQSGMRFLLNKQEIRFVNIDWMVQYEQQIGLESITFGFNEFTPYITALYAKSAKIPNIPDSFLLDMLLKWRFPRLLDGIRAASQQKIINFGKWHTMSERMVEIARDDFDYYSKLELKEHEL